MDLEAHFDEALFVVKTIRIGHGLKQVDFARIEHQLGLPCSFVFFQAAQFEAGDDIGRFQFPYFVLSPFIRRNTLTLLRPTGLGGLDAVADGDNDVRGCSDRPGRFFHRRQYVQILHILTQPPACPP